MSESAVEALPTLAWSRPPGDPTESALGHEWLVTNALGGYAGGTVAFCNTRKYHGLFIPSLVERGRMVMIGRLEEEVRVGGATHRLGGAEHADGGLDLPGLSLLEAFRLHGLVPEWTYAAGPTRISRSIVLVHNENTLYVVYRHLGGPPAQLRLRPYPLFRGQGDTPGTDPGPLSMQVEERGLELRARPDAKALRLRMHGDCEHPFVVLFARCAPLFYRVDRARGYDSTEVLASPGYFECALQPDGFLALAATVEGWDRLDRRPEEVLALEAERERRLLHRCPEEARRGTAARLVLAADQFVIAPRNRPGDEAWARATGQDARSVIAGYPWFTDWGRDTMISLDGLTLCTGRAREAGAILRTFQHYVKDGLVPNFFPEGDRAGVYHTADASLWFFHAVQRYLQETGDRGLLKDLWATLQSVADHHLQGTRFHIHVDPKDGLLHQGAQGYQLTWMDAKVGDWVVTPRRGKAVEVNALWFNALRLLVEWSTELGEDPRRWAGHAERCQASFNARFWNEAKQCLFDVVDGEQGNDPAVRPNQIFAISLAHPVLRRERWPSVMQRVREELLTPVGLRSLSPKHPDFKPAYDGDLRARDAAYHQGTVWPWLLGHYVDAALKLDPDRGAARALLSGLERHLSDACIGQVSEIFDATPPYRARGCVAQAWSVAEFLRAWLRTGASPGAPAR